VYERELAFANEVADRAAEVAMGFFRGEFEVRLKPDATPVTEADLAVEAMIRERLAREFPRDAVLGEEQGLAGDAPRVWVVDPIDGTKNFASGIQIWATLIALVDDGEPVLGLASAPALGERYAATRGGGATLNGHPIRVSSRTDVDGAFVTFGGLDGFRRSRWAGLERIVDLAGRTRGFGDFWGHMLVARGATDVMLEPELRTWDFTALAVIVREAGGRMTQLDGSPLADRGSALTTNGALHDRVVELLDHA
jgi:histidinol-phosphatase